MVGCLDGPADAGGRRVIDTRERMLDHDTRMGGRPDRFESTRQSMILAARSDDSVVRNRAVAELIDCYWKPVYKHIRIKWRASNEDAKDLTQSFFAHVLSRAVIDRYEPGRASFRTYLRTCLDHHVANAREAEGRRKRGGDVSVVAMDFDAAESELAHHRSATDVPPEEAFDREWLRALLSGALEELRRHCDAVGKTLQYELFTRYDLLDVAAPRAVTYEQLAAEYGLPVTQVTNYLAWSRREMRRIVLDRLRAVTATDDEFRDEARAVLGL